MFIGCWNHYTSCCLVTNPCSLATNFSGFILENPDTLCNLANPLSFSSGRVCKFSKVVNSGGFGVSAVSDGELRSWGFVFDKFTSPQERMARIFVCINYFG